jgi:hypothetical protein
VSGARPEQHGAIFRHDAIEKTKVRKFLDLAYRFSGHQESFSAGSSERLNRLDKATAHFVAAH